VVLQNGRLAAQGPPATTLTSDLIAEVFDLSVLIQPHPCHACPLVVPIHDTASLRTRPSAPARQS
jgi:iron complex transport system ATP-binding protein